MESKLKSFSCQIHLDEPLVRTTFDPSASKVLFCVECLLQIKPHFKVLPINDYLKQFLELDKSLPNFTSTTTTAKSEGFPDEINGFLSSESESLVKLSSHLEEEKVKIIKFYENLKQEVLKAIDSKKNDAIATLDSQLQLLKTNFNLLRNQSEFVFNGRFPVTFGSVDEAISKANKFASESEFALFIQALNDQVNQRKELAKESKDIESEITKKKEDLFEKVRDFRASLSGEFPSFDVSHKEEKALESLKKTSEMLSKQLSEINDLSHPLSSMQSRLAGSKILSSSEEEALISKEISNSGKVRYKLLYQGSRDGYGASDFHKLCDYQSPLLVLIKSNSDSRFGAYTEREFSHQQMGGYLHDPFQFQSKQNQSLSFLFNLDKKKIYVINPVMYPTLMSSPQMGPCFGSQDLTISDKCDVNLNYSVLNCYWEKSSLLGPQDFLLGWNPLNLNSLNEGSSQFLVKEIEVYLVGKEIDSNAKSIQNLQHFQKQSAYIQQLQQHSLMQPQYNLMQLPQHNLMQLPQFGAPNLLQEGNSDEAPFYEEDHDEENNIREDVQE